jgi:hypothetical protein
MRREQKMTNCLVGKYVLYSEEEYYRTGVVLAALDGAVLIQFDNMKGGGDELTLPQQLMSEEIDVWGFFDSRELLAPKRSWPPPSSPAEGGKLGQEGRSEPVGSFLRVLG